MKCYIKEMIDGVVTRQFKVYVPEFTEHGHYQQTKSMNSFTDHWNAVYQRGRPTHYFLINRSTDATLGSDFPVFDKNVVTTTCMSVWDFYDLIDWNHKRKKFNF